MQTHCGVRRVLPNEKQGAGFATPAAARKMVRNNMNSEPVMMAFQKRPSAKEIDPWSVQEARDLSLQAQNWIVLRLLFRGHERTGPGKAACLRDADAECNRMWISKTDGLHAEYFKTPRQEGDCYAGCEHCVRNRLGLSSI